MWGVGCREYLMLSAYYLLATAYCLPTIKLPKSPHLPSVASDRKRNVCSESNQCTKSGRLFKA